MPSSTARPPRAPWLRGAATLLGTVIVVLLEFALLTTVYHSGDGARERQRAFIAADAALSAWAPGASTGPVTAEFDHLEAVVGRDGVHHDQTEALIAAQNSWRTDPYDTTAQQRLQRASDRLGRSLAGDVRFADRRAAAIHAALLALVSVGWFLWFRRVVRRHRELEHTVTQAHAQIHGEHRMSALVRNSADMITVIESDTMLSFASSSIRTVTGHDPEAMVGRSFLDVIAAEDRELVTSLLAAARPGDHPVTLHATHTDGRALLLEGTLTNLLADEAVNGWVCTMRDVTERTRLQEELSHQALHDALTGLANRRLFTDRLSHALRRRRREGDVGSLVVLFLDLDDFKIVNDSRGHHVGDELLTTFAERLRATTRGGDTVARFGGDEFAVLMEDVDVLVAREVAERIVAGFAEPILAGHQEIQVAASIGLAVAVPGEVTGEDVMRNADVAMYWAKDRGKGTIAVYDADLHADALARLELQSELAHAVDHDELRLHFQPNVDLESGRIVAFEALVRWQHPTRGLVPPAAFVPIAEQSGLDVPMGSWVLREACRSAQEHLNGPGEPVGITVNVTARQIADPGFVELVTAIVAETGLDPRRLELEITESTLLADREETVRRLGVLRERGIWVAVDDFGTGYSSLSYLSDLPVDVLKIDKSFVDQITLDGGPLVDAIVSLAGSLRLLPVAEGVETAEQAWRLRRAGCRIGQGFLWSKPVPLAEATELLQNELTLPLFHALSHEATRPVTVA
ncbi:EAL domain-containing protein [Nocardioides mangrovicus]|uniref:EAL domain-containing protein n=1 Tax=Nocardioides mangrovicus TaxID=2478913 RepID=A0A3L8P0K5_9ACTN|nr:EAL domain-containing protein [Nocardioides mangrovicus]RLV48119.1 EAL domain-containing protein [Nocardioides mangrovicus]